MGILNFIIAGIGIGVGFYIQTVVGFAASLFAIPLLLAVLPMQQAIALMSVFLLLFSIILVYKINEGKFRHILMILLEVSGISLIAG